MNGVKDIRANVRYETVRREHLSLVMNLNRTMSSLLLKFFGIASYQSRKYQYRIECKETYGKISHAFRGKTIIDIGADFGISPSYFLSKGTRKVIAYTLDNPLIFDDKIEWHREFGRREYEKVAQMKDAIFKMDCEGCEYEFTIEELTSPKQGIIAIHSFNAKFDRYLVSFSKYNQIANFGQERMFTNIPLNGEKCAKELKLIGDKNV